MLKEAQSVKVALDAVDALINAAALIEDGVGVARGRCATILLAGCAVYRLHLQVVTTAYENV